MDNQKGQALLVVFLLLLFTGIVAGGTAFLWQSGVNTSGLEKNSLNAFYLANAAIERGRAMIAYESIRATGNIDNYTETILDNDELGGSYDVVITYSKKDMKEIIGTGRFRNSTREISQTIYKGSDSGMKSPPYGYAWGYWAKRQNRWKEQ